MILLVTNNDETVSQEGIQNTVNALVSIKCLEQRGIGIKYNIIL